MITIQTTENLINVAILGEFTLTDFRQFEEEANYKLRSPASLDLLFDLRGMLSYTLDVAWEEDRFFRREHRSDFRKIAVLTNDQWQAWAAWLSRVFVDADVQVFTDYDLAIDWSAD